MQPSFYSLIIPVFFIILCLVALWRIGQWRLKLYHSPLLGKIEILRKYNGEKLLTINGYGQGVSVGHPSIRKSYWYKIAQIAANFCQNEAPRADARGIFSFFGGIRRSNNSHSSPPKAGFSAKADKKKPQVLMLGLGANTIPNLIAQIAPRIQITVVELDPLIILACRQYFDLDKLSNLQLIQADAYQLIDRPQAFKNKFEVIVVDIFTGHPPFVSLQSNQPNFIEKLLPYLKKDGLMIFNRPAHTEDARKDSQKLKDYLVTLFKKTEVFDIKDSRGYRNNVIIGTTKLEF